MFTTPNTIYVPPDYQIEIDVPSVAEFVTCSLDGRLWVFRRSRRYYVAALRWDTETQRLVFVSTTILSGETVIKRGVDWILTDKSLILSSDDEPYISRTEYTSDDTSYIDTINKSYSFFPECETWQKIQSGQVIRIANAPSEMLQEIPQSLLTPLEFHCYSDNDIKAVTEFTPQLCYCNDQLYGKGKAHVGRAYLLPRTFKENGEVEDFYLYISPDYLRSYDEAKRAFNDNNGWDSLILTQLGENSLCMFTPENENYRLCKKAENGQVLLFPQLEQLDYSADNGAIFFDGLTGSNLMLNNNEVLFFRDNLSYECRGLNQWIAPSGKVDTISSQYVISSFDNGTLATHIESGFYRELLQKKMLPLSIEKKSIKQLSFNITDVRDEKILQINSILRIHHDENKSTWEKIYRTPIHFEDILSDYAVKFSMCTTSEIIESNPEWSSNKQAGWDANAWHPNEFFHYPKWLGTYPICCSAMDTGNVAWPYTYMSISQNVLLNVYAVQPNWGADFCYFVPDINEFREFHYTWDVSEYINSSQNEEEFYFKNITIRNNVIGITFYRTLFQDGYHYDNGEVFLPGPSVPEEILDWQAIGNELCENTVDENMFTFCEPFSKTLFFKKILLSRITNSNYSYPYPYYPYFPSPIPYQFRTNYFHVTRTMNFHKEFQGFFHGTFVNVNSIENGIYKRALHIADNRVRLLVFYSELHPEIFDFVSEVERSKFHEMDLPQ